MYISINIYDVHINYSTAGNVLYMYLAITIRLDLLNTTVVLFTANAIVIHSDHLYN